MCIDRRDFLRASAGLAGAALVGNRFAFADTESVVDVQQRQQVPDLIQRLRKMTAGMFIAVIAFLAAAVVEQRIQSGNAPHALWQAVQYFFLSVAEVLISVTGLEFAFTQAPPTMKGVIMGAWFVFIAAGNLLTAAVAKVNFFSGVGYYLFFSALMAVFAVLFALVARWYRPVDFSATASPRASAA